MYCVHLILARFLYWNCNNNYMHCWVILIIKSFPNCVWVATSSDCISQQSIIHIVYYLLLHPWHENVVYISNVGHGQISQMLEFQARAVLKNHDTSVSSFQYSLEWNDWIPKHVKVDIQKLCMNIVLSISGTQFPTDVAPKNGSQFLMQNKKLNILSTQKLVSNFNIISQMYHKMLQKFTRYDIGYEWN